MKFYNILVFSIVLAASLLHANDGSIASEQTKTLSPQVRASMLEMQAFQMEYDEDFWFNRDFEKFRHVLLHLVDDVGKLAKYCENKEHGIEPDTTELINAVLPDLLMHALQFSNAFEIDLGEKYEERINSNIRKISMRNAESTNTSK